MLIKLLISNPIVILEPKVLVKWVSDPTVAAAVYIKTAEGWVYLTAIRDLASRRVVGWALSETMKTEDTSIAALKIALRCYPEQTVTYYRSRDPV